jgi:hypothetical protein
MVGWVYALVAPSMPGITLFGATEGDPNERLREANACAWHLHEYTIAAAARVEDPFAVERGIHALLASRRFRPRRAFFRATAKEARVLLALVAPDVSGDARDAPIALLARAVPDVPGEHVADAPSALEVPAVPVDECVDEFDDTDRSESEYDTDDEDDSAGSAGAEAEAVQATDEPDDAHRPGYLARACSAIAAYALRHNGLLPTYDGPRMCALGHRLHYIRRSYSRLSAEERALVETIPGWSWDVHGDTFRARYAEFTEYIAYVARNPDDPLPPRDSRVRQWVKYNQTRRLRGELHHERERLLDAIPGWAWIGDVIPAVVSARRQ